MHFTNSKVEAKYEALGFRPEGLGMFLEIGRLRIQAVEHPYKGIALFLNSVSGRTAGQVETCAPAQASIEQIACLIYVNVLKCLRAEAEACRRYFENLDLHVFQ
jgi:hypothetical protein